MMLSLLYIHIASMTDSTSADDFNVTLPFLLQQAAWLYDRQLSQVRAQMLKVGNTHSQSPSPAPAPTAGSVSGSGALGGQAMRRVGSGGGFWHIFLLILKGTKYGQDPECRRGYRLFKKMLNHQGRKAALPRRELKVLHISHLKLTKIC